MSFLTKYQHYSLRVFRAIQGRDIIQSKQINLPKERFGSDYGGWSILKDSLSSKSVVYSFGIGEDITFDNAIIDKYDLIVHAFDPTPRSVKWLKAQHLSEKFIFHKVGIASFEGSITFTAPANPDHVSFSTHIEGDEKVEAPVKRLSTLMNELGHSYIDLLKMDIEGMEYDVISDIFRFGIYPKQLLIEFHHRFPALGVKKTKKALAELAANGYKIFEISSSGEEYSFIKS